MYQEISCECLLSKLRLAARRECRDPRKIDLRRSGGSYCMRTSPRCPATRSFGVKGALLIVRTAAIRKLQRSGRSGHDRVVWVMRRYRGSPLYPHFTSSSGAQHPSLFARSCPPVLIGGRPGWCTLRPVVPQRHWSHLVGHPRPLASTIPTLQLTPHAFPRSLPSERSWKSLRSRRCAAAPASLRDHRIADQAPVAVEILVRERHNQAPEGAAPVIVAGERVEEAQK